MLGSCRGVRVEEDTLVHCTRVLLLLPICLFLPLPADLTLYDDSSKVPGRTPQVPQGARALKDTGDSRRQC